MDGDSLKRNCVSWTTAWMEVETAAKPLRHDAPLGLLIISGYSDSRWGKIEL
jgi:hypothetical protein